MGDGIAPKIEPPATPGEVNPSFSIPSFGVRTDMKIFRPFAIAKCIGIRVGYAGLSSVMELGFVAQATVGTRDIKHKISLVGNPGRPMFVDEMPRHEAVEREGPVQFMRGTV